MGRRKISIAPISDDRNRQVTFLKRKNGLFKKAYELGVLCSADVAVVVFNANGKLFEFGSGNLDQILLRYSHYTGLPHEKKGPQDYANKQDLAVQAANQASTGSANNSQRRGSSANRDDDDDDDEDEEDGAGGGEEMEQDGNESVVSTSSSIKGKGKQALVAANARQSRQNSMAPNHPSSFPPPPPPSQVSQPNSSQSHSRSNSHSANHQPQDPSSSSSSTFPNYSQSFPPPHSQAPMPYQPFPPPPSANSSSSPSHHHQSQQQPQPQQAAFFPAYPPPPPNPLELFQMNGLFPSPPPANQQGGSSGGGGGGMNHQFGAGMFGPFGLGGGMGMGMGMGMGGNPFPSFPKSLGAQPQSTSTANGDSSAGTTPSSAALNYFNSGLGSAGGGGFPGMNLSNGGGGGGIGGMMFPSFYSGAGPVQTPTPTTSAQAQEGEGNNNNGAGGSGGVPNWFGAQNPMMAAAAVLYQQQQHHHQQQQQQNQQQQQSQQHHSSQPPHSSPASIKTSIERPSTAAGTSSLSPPPSHHRNHPPTRQDSTNSNNGSKPRLNLTIPTSTSSSLEQNRKIGLVTAGGASILGKGISNSRSDAGGDGRGNGEPTGNEEEEDEDSQPTAVPKSAFASDLLAAQSPFYPQQHPSNSSNPYNYPLSTSSHQFGQWPNVASSVTNGTSPSYKPAPMLGESEAPDLIRASPEQMIGLTRTDEQNREGEEEAVQRRLKRGSVDLEEGIEGLGMQEESEGSQENGSGESGSKKRRS